MPGDGVLVHEYTRRVSWQVGSMDAGAEGTVSGALSLNFTSRWWCEGTMCRRARVLAEMHLDTTSNALSTIPTREAWFELSKAVTDGVPAVEI